MNKMSVKQERTSPTPSEMEFIMILKEELNHLIKIFTEEPRRTDLAFNITNNQWMWIERGALGTIQFLPVTATSELLPSLLKRLKAQSLINPKNKYFEPDLGVECEYFDFPEAKFLKVLLNDNPKLELVYNKSLKAWCWVGYDGMGSYGDVTIRNEDTLKSLQAFLSKDLLVSRGDKYYIDFDGHCIIYELNWELILSS
ncbi:MAG: hypothetical protein CMP47_10340 [Rickettsiales bacterium]|nr:hypothetical protein [Rickettsiales bacterium]